MVPPSPPPPLSLGSNGPSADEILGWIPPPPPPTTPPPSLFLGSFGHGADEILGWCSHPPLPPAFPSSLGSSGPSADIILGWMTPPPSLSFPGFFRSWCRRNTGMVPLPPPPPAPHLPLPRVLSVLVQIKYWDGYPRPHHTTRPSLFPWVLTVLVQMKYWDGYPPPPPLFPGIWCPGADKVRGRIPLPLFSMRSVGHSADEILGPLSPPPPLPSSGSVCYSADELLGTPSPSLPRNLSVTVQMKYWDTPLPPHPFLGICLSQCR